MRRRLAFISAAIAALSANSHAFDLGLNTHSAGSAAYNDQVATVMKQRNLKSSRMDLMVSGDVTAFRDQVQKIRANGGSVEVALQVNHQWDNSCNQNLAWVEQRAYDETVATVNKVKDIVHDFEMLNETQLRPEILNEVPWNTVGTATAPYEGKPCVNSLTAALKGMSRGIRDVKASSGLPLRSMLGVVGKDFGFLTYMQNKGVQFDVVGYHIYPHYNQTSLLSDPWYGTGGPLAQLAKFNKPVHINEFNCGDAYTTSYNNSTGSATSENCLVSLDRHLTDLKKQTIVNLESVHIYEITDTPSKTPPESWMGVMYNLSQPKVQLYLLSAFAGGNLTTFERGELTRRGLLTDAEIDAYKAGGGTTTPPPPPGPESADGATIPPAASIVDAVGANWTVANGVIFRNGTATISSSVTRLLYSNKVVYQQNSVGDWWKWDSAVTTGNPWTATTDPRVQTPPPVAASPHNTTIPSAANVVDAEGATWTVSGGQIYRNGALTPSSNVNLLLYWNDVVYQRNTFNDWWRWIAGGWMATSDPRAPTDTTPPTVSITAPGNGTSFQRGASVTMTANAADNVGVNRVEFRLDGALKCTDTTAPYSCSFNLPGKRDSSITLQATAFDAAGRSTSSSIRVSTR
jgi:hypothetical protein